MLHTSSYGHHGLSPCSTDHREAVCRKRSHGNRLIAREALLLTPAAHSLCTARHQPAWPMRLDEQNGGVHGFRAGLWLGLGLHIMQGIAVACPKACRPTIHDLSCWVALDPPLRAHGAHIGHHGAEEPGHVRWSPWPRPC